MDIKLDDEYIPILREKTSNIERLVNRIVGAFLNHEIITKDSIAGMVELDKCFRYERNEMADILEEATQEFKGVAAVGRSKSQTIWVPSVKFHNMIAENDTVFVLKSKRTKGISTREGEDITAWLPDEEDKV